MADLDELRALHAAWQGALKAHRAGEANEVRMAYAVLASHAVNRLLEILDEIERLRAENANMAASLGAMFDDGWRGATASAGRLLRKSARQHAATADRYRPYPIPETMISEYRAKAVTCGEMADEVEAMEPPSDPAALSAALAPTAPEPGGEASDAPP